MDDLLEMLWLPLEVYPEYWAGMRYAARETPLFAGAYAVLATVLTVLVLRWLLVRPMTFKRAFGCCLALALLVLPGAIGNGGLAIMPLAAVVAVSVMQPIWLLYNVILLAIAALVAGIAALLVCRAAAGKLPAAEGTAVLTPRK